MEVRSYKPSDYEQIKFLLTTCELFDKSYDTEDKLKNKI